ncbi:uncharacterized protein TNCV_194971 [Trichonephila clavipes]|uniref:Uncharacterized protein n=1 Tax=Trichonephila clavipes TaxID=2585209 RepID=A0A8X7BM92_TRICX|nr:uncharacterized protein TNCV_194971 [Trichonephila clavipes]
MPSPVQSNYDAHDAIANGQYGAVWSMGHTTGLRSYILFPSNVWQQFFGRSAFLRQQETDFPPVELWCACSFLLIGRYTYLLQASYFNKTSPCRLLHIPLVKRFKETGKLEDRARAGRPCLKEERAPCIAVEMEAIASEAASGRPLIHCAVNGWITKKVNAQRYLTLLRETVVPCLIQRGQISNVPFMQDVTTSHIANPDKAFLIQTFGEDRIVSRCCRYPWLPWSPDLTPADFWLWGYLKSRVYLSGPSSLSELKDAIHREISSIHPDMLPSAVAGFVTRLECLLPCGGGHVEHILV